MADVYESKIAKFFAKIKKFPVYAVTTSATCTRWSCKLGGMELKHKLEEDHHKLQIARQQDKYPNGLKWFGWLSFMTSYIWFLVFKGYNNSPWEIEAKNVANTKTE